MQNWEEPFQNSCISSLHSAGLLHTILADYDIFVQSFTPYLVFDNIRWNLETVHVDRATTLSRRTNCWYFYVLFCGQRGLALKQTEFHLKFSSAIEHWQNWGSHKLLVTVPNYAWALFPCLHHLEIYC